jgi:hypothetical protein
MRKLSLALVGCSSVFGFDDIQPPTPRTIATPGPLAATFFYVDPLPISIAADEPDTTIYYTLDGSTPTHDSMSGLAPVTVMISEGPTTLTYFGENAIGSDDVHVDTYHFSASGSGTQGYVVTGTALGDSPIATVNVGDSVTMALAHVKIWSQNGCPMCADQLVFGVDKLDMGCLFDSARDDVAGPGQYPGSNQDATFTVTVPPTLSPGVHEVNVAFNEQNTCDQALGGSGTLADPVHHPQVNRIGILVVK